MTEGTKLNPAPLDAFETAKPDEPIFTLQGGDPLGGPLVRVWAQLARMSAGQGSGIVARMAFETAVARTTTQSINATEKECKKLLIRATHAEQISWSMDEYLKGYKNEEQKEIQQIDELEKLDIYEVRRRCASMISNFFSTLNDYRVELIKHDWLDEELDNQIQGVILSLRSIENSISIRRGK